MRYVIHFFILIFGFVFLIPTANAAQSLWISGDEVQAQLISGVSTIGQDTEIEAVLAVRLSPEWHSYWRSPGASGLPPRFDWSRSTNIKSVDISYPFPKRFDELGLTTFGYSGDILFPLRITLDAVQTDTVIDLGLDIMLCKEICIPQHLDLSLTLLAGAGEISNNHYLIKKAVSKIPKNINRPRLKIENIVAGPDGLVATVFAKGRFHRADMFVEIVGEYALTETPKLIPLDHPTRAQILIPKAPDIDNFAHAMQGKTLRITVNDGRGAIEKTITINPPAP